MNRSHSITVCRAILLVCVALLNVGLWYRTTEIYPYSFGFIICGVISLLMFARQASKDKQWGITKEGIRGFGFPQDRTTGWDKLELHVSQTHLKVEDGSRTVWIPFYLLDANPSREVNVKLLEGLGARVSRDSNVHIPLSYFIQSWGWLNINLLVLMSLWRVLGVQWQFVTMGSIGRGFVAPVLFLGFGVFVCGQPEDRIVRTQLLCYWASVLLGLYVLRSKYPPFEYQWATSVSRAAQYGPFVALLFVVGIGVMVALNRSRSRESSRL